MIFNFFLAVAINSDMTAGLSTRDKLLRAADANFQPTWTVRFSQVFLGYNSTMP